MFHRIHLRIRFSSTSPFIIPRNHPCRRQKMTTFFAIDGSYCSITTQLVPFSPKKTNHAHNAKRKHEIAKYDSPMKASKKEITSEMRSSISSHPHHRSPKQFCPRPGPGRSPHLYAQPRWWCTDLARSPRSAYYVLYEFRVLEGREMDSP